MQYITNILYILPAIFIGFVFHEFAHAKMADLLGDPTPREQGKLNLRPHTHIDFIGILLIIFAGIGWAKPIETNRSQLKNPRRDSILISLAGPLSNLIIALFGCLILLIFKNYNLLERGQTEFFNGLFVRLTSELVRINVMLFIFNLIPLPPLDGFHVIENLLPARFYKQLAFLNQYGFIFLILFIIILGDKILSPLIFMATYSITSIFNVPLIF